MDAQTLAHQRNTEPLSATDAVDRMVDAAQRLVTERIELARLDVQHAMSDTLWRALSVCFSVLFGLTGWWALMAALVLVLDGRLSLPASLGVIGLCHLLGAAAVLFGIRRASTRSS